MKQVNRILGAFEEVEFARTDIKYFRILKKSTKNYCICFTPRSGSSWLTGMIYSTRMLGNPQEWFNPEILPGILRRFPECEFETYCDLIQRRFKTPNGVFGIEVSFFQMELAERLVPVSNLFGNDLKYIYLTRRDFVAQGISLYKAVSTGHFQKKISGEAIEKLEKLEYDKGTIKEWIMHILRQEYGFEKMFKKQHLSPLRISYELLCEDPNGVVRNIADYLEISGSVIVRHKKVGHKKISDEKNVLWKERFLSDENKFVDFWGKNRGRKAAF